MVNKDVPEGYVQNKTGHTFFKAQRSLPPGAKITFAEAFACFHKKSLSLKGKQFILWLRENVFPGPEWCFYRATGAEFFSGSSEKGISDPASTAPIADEGHPGAAGITLRRESQPSGREAHKALTPSKLVAPPYEEAKKSISLCKDKVVLKKALALSQQLPNKGEHLRHLMRRIEQVN